MRSLVSYLHGNFEFKKIKEVNHIYNEKREKVDDLFQTVLTEAVSLSNKYGIEQKWEGRQITQNHVEGR